MKPEIEMDDRMKEETLSLSALLERDREMVMTQLTGDRGRDHALKVLEKEADRLMYQAGAQDDGQDGSAQGMLQVLKNMLPLIESVSEAEVWEKDAGKESAARRKPPLSSIVCGIAGVVCVIAGLIGAPAWSRIFQVLWTAAGCALLLAAGYFAGRGRRKEKKQEGNLRQAFLVDPAQIWHTLQGTLLGADHSLEMTRAHQQSQEQAGSLEAPGGMQKAELQFFSDLLENAYARRRQTPSDEALTEQVEMIRYYLHTRGIETEDYSRQSASWFEVLPAGGTAATIRPAMLQDGVLIMKGMATG